MEAQTRKFTVILEPVKEGGFVVKCVEVPVATEGETSVGFPKGAPASTQRTIVAICSSDSDMSF